jgi:gliding motility-associated protein GldL
MAKSGSFFQSKTFKVGMARVYGIGAGVVILGAMFKILHLPGAGIMLGVGLTVEALIFFLSAFEPVKEDPDWTLVYPELAGMDSKDKIKKSTSLTGELDKMLQEAKIEQNTINRLGEGLRNLNDNVGKLAVANDAVKAHDTYAQRVNEAAENVTKINASYSKAIDAMDKLGSTGEVSREYFDQIQSVTQKLASLNTVYEMELQESNQHVKALNTFVGSINKTAEKLSETENTAMQLREEIGKLNKNLSSLNSVYGNMLSAMTVKNA